MMMMHRFLSPAQKKVALAGSILALVAGATLASAQTAAPNTLTAAERAAGWKLIFDGKTMAGWKQYRGDAPAADWKVIDGAITKARGGVPDIMTIDKYADFEFSFDWKLSVEGNAGVFYRATEEYDRIYWSGPEYQLLDNIKGADNKTPLTRAGAAYGFYPAPDGHDKPSVYVVPNVRDTVRGPDGKPTVGRNGQPRLAARIPSDADVSAFLKAGEWNVSKIVVKGGHVEHWLNGFKLLEYELWSPDWEAKVQASKFRPYPNYGRAKAGILGIQGDHGGILALRNIKVRELK
jgi:hypothetical protein